MKLDPAAVTDSTGTATLYGFTGVGYQAICGGGVCVDPAGFTLTGDRDVTLQQLPPPPPPTKYTVSGTVMFDDGTPVTAGSNGVPPVTLTVAGSAGSGQVAVASDGTYTASFSAQVLTFVQLAFGGNESATTAYGNNVEISDVINLDATTGDVTLNLVVHRSKITVHVIGADGNPVPGARVTTPFDISQSNGYPVPLATSAATGVFVADDVMKLDPAAVTDSTGTATLYGFTGAGYQYICGASDCVDAAPFTLTGDRDITIQRVVKSITVTPVAQTAQVVTRNVVQAQAMTAPTTATIVRGGQKAMLATGTYGDGGTVSINATAAWTSSDSTVAVVDSSGTVTAVGVGTATITAALDGVSGTITVTVPPPALVSLAITPANPAIAKGSAQQLTAMGSFDDGSTKDLSSSVMWSSNFAGVATVDAGGQVVGVQTGIATVTASTGGVTAVTTISVTAPTLSSISVSPPNPSIVGGQTKQMMATGMYSDGSSADLTGAVSWTSSSHAILTIAGGGIATGVGVGTATITASLAGVAGATTATVTMPPPSLTSIVVTPTNPSISKGQTKQFAAVGTYSDGSKANLTGAATWASAKTSVATVTNAGTATGISVGSTTISASVGGIKATTAITVTKASLMSIAITPANASIAKGRTLQFAAVGRYTDGSTADLTTVVTWKSSATSLATITTGGLAKGTGLGLATISAALGLINSATTLAVTKAVLVKIALTPTSSKLGIGHTQQFAAVGTYSDGTTANLNKLVTWASSAPQVATVSAIGLTTAKAVGTATITVTLGTVKATATITVTK